MSTNGRENEKLESYKVSPHDFQGPSEAHRTPQDSGCFASRGALSPAKLIPGPAQGKDC